MFWAILWIIIIVVVMAICFSVCSGWFYIIMCIVGGALSLYFGIKHELKK